MGNFIKNGVIFNLKYIRENNEEIWNKYKDELIKGLPSIEDMEEVYMNELIQHIHGKVVFDFFNEMLPNQFLEEMARLKTNHHNKGEKREFI